jgi:hypothetical protein
MAEPRFEEKPMREDERKPALNGPLPTYHDDV